MTNLKQDTLANVRMGSIRSLARMKGEDIIVLDLRELSSFTDYFIIGSAVSSRQGKSICDEIEEVLKRKSCTASYRRVY